MQVIAYAHVLTEIVYVLFMLLSNFDKHVVVSV